MWGLGWIDQQNLIMYKVYLANNTEVDRIIGSE